MGRPLDEDMVINIIKNKDYYMTWIDRAMLIEEIKDLPSAQPKRKKSKWIRNDNGTYSCSLCHSWIPEEQYYYAQFCLYCGADMKSSEPEIKQCCNNCKWYRSMDDYCVSYSCNIDGREKHNCFEEE